MNSSKILHTTRLFSSSFRCRAIHGRQHPILSSTCLGSLSSTDFCVTRSNNFDWRIGSQRYLFASASAILSGTPNHHQPTLQRSMTTTTTTTNSDKDKNNNTNNDNNTSDKNTIVLYERDASANAKPRAVLAMTYFSSIYWTWYAIDFIPHVNQSPIDSLHIEPWWGVLGCTVAYTMNAAAVAYAKTMISKVELKADASQPIHIYRHSLPFMTPSTSKPLTYHVGDAALDYNTQEVQHLMTTLTSSSSSSSKNGLGSDPGIEGHLTLNLKDRRWPLGFFFTSVNDVKDPDMFLETLLFAAVDEETTANNKNDRLVNNTSAVASSGGSQPKIGDKTNPNKTVSSRTARSRTIKSKKSRQRK